VAFQIVDRAHGELVARFDAQEAAEQRLAEMVAEDPRREHQLVVIVTATGNPPEPTPGEQA
jgi:hypothetical protein